MRIFNLFAFFLLVIPSLSVLAQDDQPLPEGIMAVRGDGSVSRQIFDARISRIPVKDRTGVLRSAERLERILADLLITSQLTADAVAAGFDKGDIQYRMQLAAEKELANAWLDHYVDSHPDADYSSMAHEYYLRNKDSFQSEPSRDVTHLLVSNKERSEEELEEQAQSFLDQITSDPTVFEGLITQRSEDPSAVNNKGHFRGVKKGDMVKPFEDSAFGMQTEGEFSGLVYSRFGIHIIRLDKINPPRQLTFEEVEGRLATAQEQTHKERIRNTYLSELGTMVWQVSDEEIKAMVASYFGEDAVPQDSEKPESK